MRYEPVTGVQPEIFRWARVSVGLSVTDVAAMLKRDPEDVAAWEAGTKAPTYPQLETLAYQVYKRPLAVFFLPSPPEEQLPQREFRTLPDADMQTLARDTDLHIRRAHTYQLAFRDLSKSTFDDLIADQRIWWGKTGRTFPFRKRFRSELGELVPTTVWIAPNPGDLVLDSFAGSGTTGAVAHKMGRRWIIVELGEQCHTHIIPRLRKVIDGKDPGGITKAVDWKGGGGFRYYRLAPSLLEKDTWGNWVINRDYNAAMLAEALCKLEGFIYAPSDTLYWQHGYSTESDFIYITTANLSHEQLEQLNDEVGPERSLLVLCTAFRARADLYSNLTIKKIPRQILSRCEWGRDDYSLRVENLPSAPPQPGQHGFDFGQEDS
ncbi:DNA methyltransferase [Thiocapsa marina]|uniref:DNA methylase N-4/N-6 domain protein n=1 Tax=Thiocapsa marina 5811 TaxID=768671 RepID=F9U7U3_9GAMM|nr:DNA methylase N-4/N-6 domain protein [Thiocapsa marina 5811]